MWLSVEESVEGGVVERGVDVVFWIEEKESVVALDDVEGEGVFWEESIAVLWLKVEDLVVTSGEVEEIRSVAAVEHVAAESTAERVVAISALERVAAGSTAEDVIPEASVEAVMTFLTSEEISA